MKIFIIIFVIAILFVVGSAMMMQYFTGKSINKIKKSGAKNTIK